MRSKSGGQIVIGAIVLLVILAILVPGLIAWMQNESKWTVKEQRTTRAFQLAESAVERGFQKVIQSTGVWNTLMAGGTISGYDFDQTYSDLSGGKYEIDVVAGPGTQAATITGVGRDTSNNEIRSVRAVYSNTAAKAALIAVGGLTLASNPGVEWGMVMSPASIITDKLHPRFYGASDVSLDTNGAVPPNSDNRQWWSYYPNLPPIPEIDTLAYLSSATAQGHVFGPGSYRMHHDICGGPSCSGVYYFTGDTTLRTPAARITSGAIVVMGNLTLQGSAGGGNYNADVPSQAWREYGNDWAYYRSEYDGSAPALFPGVTGSYSSGSLTYNINNVLVNGFMYVKNALSITGGGNLSVHGTLHIGDSTSMSGSHVMIYYDDSVTVMTKTVSLMRESWQEVGGCTWTGTHPVCP